MNTCNRKNRKIRGPCLLYALADSILPLMSSEKLRDKPELISLPFFRFSSELGIG